MFAVNAAKHWRPPTYTRDWLMVGYETPFLPATPVAVGGVVFGEGCGSSLISLQTSTIDRECRVVVVGVFAHPSWTGFQLSKLDYPATRRMVK